MGLITPWELEEELAEIEANSPHGTIQPMDILRGTKGKKRIYVLAKDEEDRLFVFQGTLDEQLEGRIVISTYPPDWPSKKSKYSKYYSTRCGSLEYNSEPPPSGVGKWTSCAPYRNGAKNSLQYLELSNFDIVQNKNTTITVTAKKLL